MEKIVEIVEITHSGKTTVWQVVDQANKERRAYLKGSTFYYDMPKFEAGLLEADSFTRTPA